MRLGAWVLLALLPATLFGAVKPRYTAPQVFDKVLKAQESMAWMQADATKVEGPIGAKAKDLSLTKGRLQSQPGGLARLDISAPSKGLILADGKSLWVELSEVEQVMKYDARKLAASGNFFLDLASSIRHYSKASQRRLIPAGEGFDASRVTALELQPLKPQQAGFERLRVWVDEKDWVVLRVLMDYGGTRSDIRFEGVKVLGKDALAKDPKLGLDPALFKYKPPKGYEVFDLDL